MIPTRIVLRHEPAAYSDEGTVRDMIRHDVCRSLKLFVGINADPQRLVLHLVRAEGIRAGVEDGGIHKHMAIARPQGLVLPLLPSAAAPTAAMFVEVLHPS